MLGLYWLDGQELFDPASSDPKTYDYLLLADHAGAFGGDIATALDWVTSPASEVEFWQWATGRIIGNGPGIDGAFVDGLAAGTAPSAGAPERGTWLRSVRRLADGFRRPACAIRASRVRGPPLVAVGGAARAASRNLSCLAGFPGSPDPGRTAPPPADAFVPLPGDLSSVSFAGEAHPVLGPPREDRSSPENRRPAGWPPHTLLAFDSPFQTGWFSYRVSGIDLFGRHSEASNPASWHSFHETAGDVLEHPFALDLQHDRPPPPPTGVEATVLDPLDPHLVRDADYEAWRSALPASIRDTRVGLRVRWRWPLTHQRQAPDMSHFILYVHGGRPNVLTGRATRVSPLGPGESEVDTDIPPPRRASRLVGTRLKVGSDTFKIARASGSPGLRLRVTNVARIKKSLRSPACARL